MPEQTINTTELNLDSAATQSTEQAPSELNIDTTDGTPNPIEVTNTTEDLVIDWDDNTGESDKQSEVEEVEVLTNQLDTDIKFSEIREKVTDPEVLKLIEKKEKGYNKIAKSHNLIQTELKETYGLLEPLIQAKETDDPIAGLTWLSNLLGYDFVTPIQNLAAQGNNQQESSNQTQTLSDNSPNQLPYETLSQMEQRLAQLEERERALKEQQE